MERVGGDETLRVNVRIIAATNRHLEEEVRLGHFREDLYYRLNVMPIAPALAARASGGHRRAGALPGRKIGQHQGRTLRISEGAIRLLMEYSWPGNVRELENCPRTIGSDVGEWPDRSRRDPPSLTRIVPPKPCPPAGQRKTAGWTTAWTNASD